MSETDADIPIPETTPAAEAPAAPEPEEGPLRRLWEDEDAALDRLFPRGGPDDDGENPAADEFVSVLAGEEPKPAEATPEPAAPAAPAQSEEYTKALAALKLDRVPDELISTLSPEQVVLLGGALRERQREINERLAKAKKPAEGTPETEKATTEAEPAEPTASADLKKVVEEFSELYGPEGGGVLTKLATALEGRFLEAQRSQEAQLLNAQAMVQQLMAERVRDQLKESIPQLADDEAYGKVVEEMALQASTGKYASVSPTVEGRLRKLMQDSALLALGPPAAASQKPPPPKPTLPPQVRAERKPPLKADEVDDLVLDLIDKGFHGESLRRRAEEATNRR